MLELPEKKVRKVVQILEFDGRLVRLCDDGTIWYQSAPLDGCVWKRCPDVPQGDE